MDPPDRQRREQDKDELLALLGHELRNPLGPIRNAVHILRSRGVADAQGLWALDLIERQLDELVTVIDSVSEVSRIFRGVATIAPIPFSIGSAVDSAVRASAPMLEQKQQRCDVRLPPAEVEAVGDRKRTEQLVRAMLRCASRALTTGAAIEVRAAVAGDRWTIGMGTPGAAQSTERQADEQGAAAQEVSVGLTLVRGLSELLGGRFAVRAASGDAVCYELELPRRAA